MASRTRLMTPVVGVPVSINGNPRERGEFRSDASRWSRSLHVSRFVVIVVAGFHLEVRTGTQTFLLFTNEHVWRAFPSVRTWPIFLHGTLLNASGAAWATWEVRDTVKNRVREASKRSMWIRLDRVARSQFRGLMYALRKFVRPADR